MIPNQFFVEGLPATFATPGEPAWREALTRSIKDPTDQAFLGVNLSFTLPTLEPRGHPLDIDNLCEPVFSILINKRGYFGGRRPNLRWWEARKARGQQCGVHVMLEEAEPRGLAVELGEPLFSELYSGSLPSSATDPNVPNWLRSLGINEASAISGDYVCNWIFRASASMWAALPQARLRVSLIACTHCLEVVLANPRTGGSIGFL